MDKVKPCHQCTNSVFPCNTFHYLFWCTKDCSMKHISENWCVCCIIWWRHQMETFPRYWPFVRGIHRPSVNSPHKGQWRGALMFPFICVWNNSWVNNEDAGDLRRHCAHYGVYVMVYELYFEKLDVHHKLDIHIFFISISACSAHHLTPNIWYCLTFVLFVFRYSIAVQMQVSEYNHNPILLIISYCFNMDWL